VVVTGYAESLTSPDLRFHWVGIVALVMDQSWFELVLQPSKSVRDSNPRTPWLTHCDICVQGAPRW
jgi:hypothetical protein